MKKIFSLIILVLILSSCWTVKDKEQVKENKENLKVTTVENKEIKIQKEDNKKEEKKDENKDDKWKINKGKENKNLENKDEKEKLKEIIEDSKNETSTEDDYTNKDIDELTKDLDDEADKVISELLKTSD